MRKCSLRNHFIWVLFAAAVVFTYNPASAKNKFVYDQLLKADRGGYQLTPVGLCEDYPEETTTLDIIRADMELLKRSDVKFLRISFGWDGIETAKDQYNWGFWDDFVKIAVDDYGITLIPYICYTPRWNSTGDSLNFWNHTPADYDEFGEFMGDLVNRYKDRIHSWELWNEPDIDAFWSGNAADLAKLTKIGSKAIREADPEAIVVLGGIAWDVKFLEEVFKIHEISPYVDVVNCHNYFETWHNGPIEDIIPYVNEVQNIIDKYGDKQSLWMAEVGYSTWRMTENMVSHHYTAYYDYEHTFDFQAVQIFRTLTMLYATEKMDAIAWYEIKDLPMGEDVIGDNNNRNLGVAEIDHTAKPGEKTLRFFNSLLGKKYKVNSDLQLSGSVHPSLHFHTFDLADGSTVAVAWFQTAEYSKREEDSSGQVKDTRVTDLSIMLDSDYSRAELFTATGESRGEIPIEKRGWLKKNYSVNGIALVGGDIMILKLSK
ncbi:MAG: cellulase family glycosylhydrolase [Candidatus Marinimicrobia bacterium]|nr:cellulase family glycosylhydrolase [Candidatus Neomarinimicrobiota bacterium]